MKLSPAVLKTYIGYVLVLLLLLLLASYGVGMPVSGATADPKTWFLYVIFMTVACGGSLLLLVWIPFRTFLVLDWKKRTLKSKVSRGLTLGYFYFVLHMVAGLVYVGDSTNYMYSVQMANDGFHYRSWGRGYVLKWNDIESANVVRGNKGTEMLIVYSKTVQPLKITSQAYWNWDQFLVKVKGQMGRHHELARYHPLNPNSTDINFFM